MKIRYDVACYSGDREERVFKTFSMADALIVMSKNVNKLYTDVYIYGPRHEKNEYYKLAEWHSLID